MIKYDGRHPFVFAGSPVEVSRSKEAKDSGSQSAIENMGFNFKENRDWAENLAILTQVGLTMAGCIVFCFFIGRFVDRMLGTRGIFVVLFILLGVIGGANVVYRQIMKVMDSPSETDRKPNDGNR